MLIVINIKLPPNIEGKEKIILQFRFENSRSEVFGESLIAIIDLRDSIDESQIDHNSMNSLA